MYFFEILLLIVLCNISTQKKIRKRPENGLNLVNNEYFKINPFLGILKIKNEFYFFYM